MPKLILTCLEKTEIAPKVYVLKFKLNEIVSFVPGQFVSLEVTPKIYRSYSIVNISQTGILELLISTKSNGEGSKVIENIQINKTLNGIGPVGKFSLNKSNKSKVFIATGTGLAPFVPMIKQCLADNSNSEITLFFGVASLEFDFCRSFFKDFLNPNFPNFKIFTCSDSLTEEEKLLDNVLLERVTAAVPEFITDYTNSDFYICGNPFMVTDMQTVLEQKGASTNIFTEKYTSPVMNKI